jgi:hypothetical protein
MNNDFPNKECILKGSLGNQSCQPLTSCKKQEYQKGKFMFLARNHIHETRRPIGKGHFLWTSSWLFCNVRTHFMVV